MNDLGFYLGLALVIVGAIGWVWSLGVKDRDGE